MTIRFHGLANFLHFSPPPLDLFLPILKIHLYYPFNHIASLTVFLFMTFKIYPDTILMSPPNPKVLHVHLLTSIFSLVGLIFMPLFYIRVSKKPLCWRRNKFLLSRFPTFIAIFCLPSIKFQLF